jgi:hypothetical protein
LTAGRGEKNRKRVIGEATQEAVAVGL